MCVTFALASFLVLCLTSCQVRTQANFETAENFRAEIWSRIPLVRGLIVDESGDVLAVAQRTSRITAVFRGDDNTIQTAVIVSKATLRLTHGIAYDRGFLYASSDTTVFRWPYKPGQREIVSTDEEIVIHTIPGAGDHITRTLVFDKTGLLYVSLGSASNVDPDSTRARIKRFNLSNLPAGGINWDNGILVADGLRNEVGLAFDASGMLWGVQNGADRLVRDDLGGDIHNTNPAEEMTRYDQLLGTHYGYPYCWTSDELQGHPRGEQFAWPTFMSDGIHTDSWCKDPKNNFPPTLPLPAHYAALGIEFYDGRACNNSAGAFPCFMRGDAFVAFHGSWNKEPPAGYRVVRLPFDLETGLPTGEIIDIIFEPDMNNCQQQAQRCFRPVNAIFDHNGHMIVSSDESGDLIRVTYDSSPRQG